MFTSARLLALASAAAGIFASTSISKSPGRQIDTSDTPKPYTIVSQLTYSGTGNLPLRYGNWSEQDDSGFGWIKIFNKHNITLGAAIEYVSRSPNRHHTGGTTYEHEAYANEVTCSHNRCKLTDQIKVVLKLDERELRDGHRFGVVTQYCQGVQGKCPDWVTTVLADGNGQLPEEDSDSLTPGRAQVLRLRSHSAEIPGTWTGFEEPASAVSH